MPGQESYYYDKPVVILISETTQQCGIYNDVPWRTGENVTVLGNNPLVQMGNITYLPLLNGHKITFTSLGIYTPDGGQTQRIGLSPDIEVYPTVDGIKEGKDIGTQRSCNCLYSGSRTGTKAE